MVLIYNRSLLSTIFTFFVLFAALLAYSPAYSQDTYSKLNESNIKNFINLTSKITSGSDSGMTQEEVALYLDTHLDKKARFKSTMQYNIPGHPPQETSMSLDKKEFIKSIEDGAKSVTDHKYEININNIDISKDGKKATVQTSGFETGIMPIVAEGVEQNVPVEGSSDCNQVISLSKKGVIQMQSAQCITVISFEAY